jgi:hypothetical protein
MIRKACSLRRSHRSIQSWASLYPAARGSQTHLGTTEVVQEKKGCEVAQLWAAYRAAHTCTNAFIDLFSVHVLRDGARDGMRK